MFKTIWSCTSINFIYIPGLPGDLHVQWQNKVGKSYKIAENAANFRQAVAGLIPAVCVCATAEKWGRKSKYVRADQEQESSGGVSCANTFNSALALARLHSHKHIK